MLERIKVGVDMDGVICSENVDEYNYITFKYSGAKLVHELDNLFMSMQVNEPIRQALNFYSTWMDFYVVSARAYAGAPDGHVLGRRSIQQFLLAHGMDDLADKVRVSKYRFKLFQTYDLKAMIDNDALNLSRLPRIGRYAYEPFYRDSIISEDRIDSRLNIYWEGEESDMFEKILDNHYPPMVF